MSRAKLVLATSNQGKVREIKRYLAGLPFDILSLCDIGCADDVEENGRSFLENARLKSLAWSLRTKFLTLAEDSGLEVEHLGGAPGVYSARFSAPRPTDEKNIQKVLRLMRGVPWSERKARFVSCFVLSQNGNVIKEVRGQVRGYIALEKKGDLGFGYDPIFYYSRWKKNFGELPLDEKNRVSHRGRALKKMAAFIQAYVRRHGK